MNKALDNKRYSKHKAILKRMNLEKYKNVFMEIIKDKNRL